MKKIFRKLTKTFIILVVCFIVFVVLVVIFVHRDETTGKITISFKSNANKISDNGFSDILSREASLASLTQVDWAEAYNQALNKQNTQIADTKNNQTGNLKETISTQKGPNSNQKVYEKFVKYLQASNVQLDGSQNPLNLAIQYRDNDQKDKINGLITNLDKKIASIETIVPPEEAVGYHLAKLRLLREISAILSKIKASDKGVALEQIIPEEEFSYLAGLDIILQKYLTYFFYSKISG
ncbi:MAG: hypothetical protein WC242_02975 [Candidatus Paceibacterota bacterium]|jgi:hypothetical protein